MELQSSLVIMILVLVVGMMAKKKMKTKSGDNHKLPPGPWKVPVIGNLHQVAVAGSLPHHGLRQLARRYGPLMHLQLGEISTIVVSSPDIAKQILKTHDLAFVQRPQLLSPKILAYDSADIAFAPYGDYWRQMRKICTLELLSAKRVQSFSYIRQEEVAELVRSIHLSPPTSPLNLTKAVFSMLSTIVSRAAFGKRSEQEDELISLVKEAVELTGGFDLADLFPSLKPLHLITRLKAKLENMLIKLDKILDTIVNEHQENMMRMRSNTNHASHSRGEAGDENLVHVLLRVQQSGSLDIPVTLNNIKAVIWDIFAAGTDTSATVLEWAMSELIKNPIVMKKAQSEVREAFKGRKTVNETDIDKLRYLKLVIKETMRLHPPVPLLLPRECREECNIGGYEIPIKTKVIVNAWALGRDPEHWHEAERFMPERFDGTNIDFKGNNFEYIPFGAGRRICPGISLGLVNVELPLAALLFHFDWELPIGMKPDDLDMDESFGAAVGRKNSLYLVPTPYYHNNNAIAN